MDEHRCWLLQEEDYRHLLMYKIMYWVQGEEFKYASYKTLEEAEKDFDRLTKNKTEVPGATHLELTDKYLDEIKVFCFLEDGTGD